MDTLLTSLLRPVKRRVFISYHHKDEAYRDAWEKAFGDICINHSVRDGEIASDVSTEYIKRLIQTDKLSSASVVVVLLGPKTYCRKHVDWEISAGLSSKVGGVSGLMGILLPNHPDAGKLAFSYDSVPARFGDNQQSGYAKCYAWAAGQETMRLRIDDAFNARFSRGSMIRNGRIQMTRNTCE